MRAASACALLACLLPTVAAPHKGRPRPILHTLRVFVTGYTYTGSRTATGAWPRACHTAATDPGVIPLGDRMRIAGLPCTYVAEDTGGAIRGARVDLYMASDPEAYAITGWRTVTYWRAGEP